MVAAYLIHRRQKGIESAHGVHVLRVVYPIHFRASCHRIFSHPSTIRLLVFYRRYDGYWLFQVNDIIGIISYDFEYDLHSRHDGVSLVQVNDIVRRIISCDFLYDLHSRHDGVSLVQVNHIVRIISCRLEYDLHSRHNGVSLVRLNHRVRTISFHFESDEAIRLNAVGHLEEGSYFAFNLHNPLAHRNNNEYVRYIH